MNMKMKKSSSFEFPVSLVKQYLYCPRIPYFTLIVGAKERITELMKYGREEHKKRLRKMEKKGWKTNVLLKSEKYGIYGYVDAFRKEGNGYVVYEFKNTEYKKNVFKMHLYQTAAYALLVEENFGRVIKLVVEYGDKKVEAPFTRGIKNYAVSIINKIHRIGETGLVSVKIDRRKCYNCGFRYICREI
ncbi:CRISPR-associated protein Cas4 [Archaeoglobus fulgidus DSM 8774]|uniref:CRISPR-associated exonuclease Cas4 n=2 Tax=Archaeoglobus fulgidus TaxID=2234 RepID=A0A075WIK6_ARCFL|nr:CRISPR-associated protein Cas4 [Archaeoglobus fulgidus DSM 8774]